jgi:hypothetical protein
MDVHTTRVGALQRRMRELDVERCRGRTGFGPALPDRLRRPTARAADAAHRRPMHRRDRRAPARAGTGRAGGPAAGVEVHSYGEHDDALALAAGLVGADERATIALGDQMWTSFTLGLQRELPGRRWIRASEVVAPLRAVKDAEELARLAAVGRAIDEVHLRVPEVLAAGRTEREVAATSPR